MSARLRKLLLAPALLLTLGPLALWARAEQQQAFPHETHARLFPVCSGCHEGIEAGDSATSFPGPQLCSRCHDGTRAQIVRWAGPTPRADNLRFTHVLHVAKETAAGARLQCSDCHARVPDRWMSVTAAQPATCISCHAHAAPQHLAEQSQCRTCHVPVTEARALTVARIERFPAPPSHDSAAFLSKHGTTPERAQQRCAICHTRETCARCHLNANSVAAIRALGSDARLAAVAARQPARYALPASHTSPAWPTVHGNTARANIQSCANCHAQQSCRSCHTSENDVRILSRLPRAQAGGPQGVVIPASRGSLRTVAAPVAVPRPRTEMAGAQEPREPQAVRAGQAQGAQSLQQPSATAPRVHPPGFDVRHGGAAATQQPRCAACHAQTYCAKCHTAASKPAFHPSNFAVRHASDAFGTRTQCAVCHNTETFCRACHQTNGRAAQGRADVSYHDAQPLWLFQHGQAARQSLQTCTSCHRQNDCLQCHSALGRRVNPHGADFDPQRVADRNRIVCSRCHFGDPLSGR